MTSVTTKYWVISGLTAVTAVLTYLQGQPNLSEGTIIGAGILVAGLLVHDFETEPTPGETTASTLTVAPPSSPAVTVVTTYPEGYQTTTSG